MLVVGEVAAVGSVLVGATEVTIGIIGLVGALVSEAAIVVASDAIESATELAAPPFAAPSGELAICVLVISSTDHELADVGALVVVLSVVVVVVAVVVVVVGAVVVVVGAVVVVVVVVVLVLVLMLGLAGFTVLLVAFFPRDLLGRLVAMR